MKVTIIKRDGKPEDFDIEKIARVAQASGLRPVDAEELSKTVADWVESLGKKSITSIEIRDKVFEELEKKDKYASGLFAWYQTTKDKND